MTRPSGIIRLYIKAPQTLPLPIAPPPRHIMYLPSILYLPQQHNRAENAKPVWAKGLKRQGVNHGIRIALFDLPTELVAEVGEERQGDLVGCREGDYRCDGDAVAEGHLAGCYAGRKGAAGYGEGHGACRAVRGYCRRVLEHRGHGACNSGRWESRWCRCQCCAFLFSWRVSADMHSAHGDAPQELHDLHASHKSIKEDGEDGMTYSSASVHLSPGAGSEICRDESRETNHTLQSVVCLVTNTNTLMRISDWIKAFRAVIVAYQSDTRQDAS